MTKFKLTTFILFSAAASASAAFVPQGPVQIANVNGSSVTVGYQTNLGSVPVQLQNSPSATPTGAWSISPGTGIYRTDGSGYTQTVSGTLTSNTQVLVSSSTSMPSAVADAGSSRFMGDKFGRVVTQPIVPQSQVRIATATITSSTAWLVFVSSPGANNFNHLIGCIGTNTSATNTYLNFQPGCGIAANSFILGMPANDIPVGFFPPSGIPQLGTANSDWCISAANSVASILLSCEFYVAP